MGQLAWMMLLVVTMATPPGTPLTLRNNDRVVFVGDDLTQQMFYTRAVATAMLSLNPTGSMRFYNGGRDGATAAQAVEWIDDLFQLTKPTVVVLAFGLGDVADPNDEDESFEVGLSNLIAPARRYPGVRRVLILSPPALPKETGPQLETFCKVARTAAQNEGVTFVDIYHPMRKLYDTADETFFEQLKLGDRLASESMHLVVASHLLAGLGVTGEQLDRVGFAPLPPEQMGRVRRHFAQPTRSVSVEASGLSRELYLALGPHDELFFRLWRLSQSPPASPQQSGSALRLKLTDAWAAVANRASRFAHNPRP